MKFEMHEDQDLICKCGGSLNFGLCCRDCGIIWQEIEDWMIWPQPVKREFTSTQMAIIDHCMANENDERS